MKAGLTIKRLGHLYVQRNVLFTFSVLLGMSNLVLGMALVVKRERVVITPPDLKRSYWVEGNRFSPSYLEAWTLHCAHLLLDVTASNLSSQGAIVLLYVIPESYGAMTEQLQPVIQVAAGRSVDIVFTQGAALGESVIRQAVGRIHDKARYQQIHSLDSASKPASAWIPPANDSSSGE
jgi:type IV conjugative transfer system protein TraE